MARPVAEWAASTTQSLEPVEPLTALSTAAEAGQAGAPARRAGRPSRTGWGPAARDAVPASVGSGAGVLPVMSVKVCSLEGCCVRTQTESLGFAPPNSAANCP